MTAGPPPADRDQVERIPLNTFAIAFGLAGLAEVWTSTCRALAWPQSAAQIAWIGASIAWICLIIAHIERGARSSQNLAEQLRHPAQGPIASLVPTTGMLLGAALYDGAPTAGVVVVVTCLVVAVGFGGWIVSTWFDGRLELGAVHGGYLLPTVATGLVGGDAAAHIHLPVIAWAMFGIGTFFWAVMMPLLVLRLTISPLPGPLVPTIAIIVAPPAVGGITWFALNGGVPDTFALALGGLTVFFGVIQIALIGRYRRLQFSIGFWSFTFPLAAVVTVAIMWLAAIRTAGWEVITIALAVLITTFIGVIGFRSVLLIDWRRGTHVAEETISRADDLDAGIQQVP